MHWIIDAFHVIQKLTPPIIVTLIRFGRSTKDGMLEVIGLFKIHLFAKLLLGSLFLRLLLWLLLVLMLIIRLFFWWRSFGCWWFCRVLFRLWFFNDSLLDFFWFFFVCLLLLLLLHNALNFLGFNIVQWLLFDDYLVISLYFFLADLFLGVCFPSNFKDSVAWFRLSTKLMASIFVKIVSLRPLITLIFSF